jgi:hypothetical protein
MRISIVLALALPAALAAQQEPPKPAPAAEAVEATLVALKGTVDVKRPEDKDFVPAERNMKLKKGSEICTAVASNATLLFTGNVKVVVKPLTQAKIDELAKQGGAVNADVNLKFGTIEVDIKKGDLKADMKVTAPNSTTSVSGSLGWVRCYAAGGGGFVTLQTQSGTWNQFVPGLGLDFGVEGAGAANEQGDLPGDLGYAFASGKFLHFFGKGKDELYQGKFNVKAGDAHPWDVPFFEFAGTGPSSYKHRKPAILPRPPNPPFP